jgi:hypothetical protein
MGTFHGKAVESFLPFQVSRAALFYDLSYLKRKCMFLPYLLRFSKPKTPQYEDQIEAFPYSFRGFTIGKIVTVLGDPKAPHQIRRLPH